MKDFHTGMQSFFGNKHLNNALHHPWCELTMAHIC